MRRTESSPPHGDGWRLRAYRDGDERWIVKQFERVFRRPMSEEMWRWKFKAAPSPVENVWLAVDDDDRPVFQYATMPRRLRLPTGIANVLVLVDLWTAPEYRGRGIFTTSARWVHDYWRRSGITGALIAANAREKPRRQGHKGTAEFGWNYRRLGWQYLFPLRWQIRPLRPEAIAARRLGVGGLARQRWLGDTWNRLWDRRARSTSALEIRNGGDAETPGDGHQLAGSVQFALEHGADWQRWRYLACPHHSYSLLTARRAERPTGHLAFRMESSDDRRFAFVAELVARSPEVESALIDAVIENSVAQDAVAVATLAVPGTDLARAWRRRGFLFSWGRFYVHWLPLQEGPPVDHLRNPQAWEMSGGDYDAI